MSPSEYAEHRQESEKADDAVSQGDDALFQPFANVIELLEAYLSPEYRVEGSELRKRVDRHIELARRREPALSRSENRRACVSVPSD